MIGLLLRNVSFFLWFCFLSFLLFLFFGSCFREASYSSWTLESVSVSLLLLLQLYFHCDESGLSLARVQSRPTGYGLRATGYWLLVTVLLSVVMVGSVVAVVSVVVSRKLDGGYGYGWVLSTWLVGGVSDWHERALPSTFSLDDGWWIVSKARDSSAMDHRGSPVITCDNFYIMWYTGQSLKVCAILQLYGSRYKVLVYSCIALCGTVLPVGISRGGGYL
ncbi:hypothetical protein BZA05DRAFT_387656, partial [Tricharina praecox]|uniref:uncharacterized protein n=1 Tax=Tricharina praecox TaxID=43433 RepID=UPI00221EA5D2